MRNTRRRAAVREHRGRVAPAPKSKLNGSAQQRQFIPMIVRSTEIADHLLGLRTRAGLPRRRSERGVHRPQMIAGSERRRPVLRVNAIDVFEPLGIDAEHLGRTTVGSDDEIADLEVSDRFETVWASDTFVDSGCARPRMYASGATSITPALISFGISSGSIMSCSASYSGRRYGSIFSLSVPGRKPRRSPASTAGRVRMIRLTCLVCNALTALAIARYVLPVPAGPDAEDDGVRIDRVDVALLVQRLGPDRLAAPRQDVERQHLGGRLVARAGEHGDAVAAPPPGSAVWPLATIAMSSETTRSASATSAGSPDR